MRDYIGEASIRWAECCRIAEHAQRQGILATPAKVNRRLDVWRRWYEGRYATGYLIMATGVKLRERQ